MQCELCNSLPLGRRTEKRHERLRQIGLTQRIARPGHAKAAWVTYHVCDLCATQWRHIDDPGNLQVGWSIEPNAIPCVM